MEDNRDLGAKAAGFPRAGESSFTALAVEDSLERILASRTFRLASSQRKFLQYAVRETLAGRANSIKEYSIATEALGRGAGFDPRLDPIVRTEARKLRARLVKYYGAEGADDPVRIDFPKGSYAPSFSAPPTQAATSSPTNEVHPVEAPVIPVAGGPRAVARHWRSVAAVVALCVAIAAAGLYARFGFHGSVLAAEASPSIAVLPFVNLSNGKDGDFLSDGLTEELIQSLKQVPGLDVTARTSAFRYKSKSTNLREIGIQLHVRMVLVGSVQNTGDRVRITAQLNSVADGSHLWSGNYDRDVKDSRLIAGEVSQAVANVLHAGLRRDAQPQSAKAALAERAPTPAAYKDYLKGRYFWNRLTPEGLKSATQFFEQAIAEDPSYARAYASLADCYVMAPQVSTTPASEVVPMIQAAAMRALELDGSLGEPHLDLAVSAEYQYDWATADREFKKGLELSPGNAVGHLWYAKYLAIVGRRDEVLTHRRIAAELDPVSPYAVQAVGGYYSVVGRYDEAIEQFQSALALEPGFGLAHQGLGVAYLLKGNHADAITELQAANQHMRGPRRMALLGYAYAVSGQTAEARQILNSFLDQSKRGPFPALAIAQIYIGLGEKDRAFEWLQRAIDQQDLDTTLLWDSFYEVLRSDPRFPALLRRMNLASS